MYCIVLKRIQLTGAECEESINTRDNGPDKSTSLHQCMTHIPLVAIG